MRDGLFHTTVLTIAAQPEGGRSAVTQAGRQAWERRHLDP